MANSSPSTPPLARLQPGDLCLVLVDQVSCAGPTWPSAALTPDLQHEAHAGRAGACAALVAGAAQAAAGEKIGTVDTAFQWIGRDHDIIVEACGDPWRAGRDLLCRGHAPRAASRARWAWPKTAPGLDRLPPGGADQLPRALKKREEVFSERMSILFKRLRIVRMVDAPRNTLVYLTYSKS